MRVFEIPYGIPTSISTVWLASKCLLCTWCSLYALSACSAANQLIVVVPYVKLPNYIDIIVIQSRNVMCFGIKLISN